MNRRTPPGTRLKGARASWLLFVGFAAAGIAGAVWAAELRLDPAEPVEDGRVCLPVYLARAAHEDVSGLQFELAFDAARLAFAEVTAGDAATGAHKDLFFNARGPGRVVVIVAGLNQSAIAPGVVAHCCFTASASAPGTHSVALEQVALSNPYGVPLPARSSPGTVTVGVSTQKTAAGSAPGGAVSAEADGGPRVPPGVLIAAAAAPLLCAAAIVFHRRRRVG